MASAPEITTVAELPDARIGVLYSSTLVASGDPTPTWSVSTGSLPSGLSLSTAGVISGTPTTAESQTVTVTAANTSGSDSLEFSITVLAADIASVADLAEHLGETIPAGQTAAAQAAIDNATAALRARCSRTLTQGRETATITATSPVVDLPETPVVTVHSVTVDGTAVAESATGYVLNADGSLIFASMPYLATVVVDYTYGFAADSKEYATAKGLVLRRAERTFNNPRNRSAYSGPEALNYTTDAPSRTWTTDELAEIALIERPGGFA